MFGVAITSLVRLNCLYSSRSVLVDYTQLYGNLSGDGNIIQIFETGDYRHMIPRRDSHERDNANSNDPEEKKDNETRKAKEE